MRQREVQCPHCGSWILESQRVKLELHFLMECRPDYMAVGIRNLRGFQHKTKKEVE